MGFRPAAFVPIVAVWFVLGCPGDGTGLDENGNPLGPNPPADTTSADTSATLSGDVQPIFTANCALSGCHAGTGPAAGMNLGAGLGFAHTVNRPSTEVPGRDRIEPFQPDASYLINKIEGTAGSVGGIPSRMPLGGAPLSQAQIDLIRSWILAGAQNN